MSQITNSQSLKQGKTIGWDKFGRRQFNSKPIQQENNFNLLSLALKQHKKVFSCH